MEPCTTYQNTHHQLTVVIGSQRGKTCWPFMFKLMSNIKLLIIVASCELLPSAMWCDLPLSANHL